MPTLTASTTFIITAAEEYTETLDLVLLPENAGTELMRELHYPGDVLDPIIYPDMPDWWEGFDSGPLTAKPLSKVEMTLAGNKAGRWSGYLMDNPVREGWAGADTRSRVEIAFFRRLAEYFFNPPATGYLVWKPRDRTTKTYYVIFEDLTVGGNNIRFNYPAIFYGQVTGELVVTLRVVAEVV